MFEPVGYQTIYSTRVDCQIELESSLPRATGKAEEGSKNGLRSDLRPSNFPWGCAPKEPTYLRHI